MASTKEELIAEREEHKSRAQEIDSAYHGQYIDPESDDGQEWANRNARIDEIDKIVAQMTTREARLVQLAKEPESREAGATFYTPKSGVARGDDIFDLSTVRSSVSNPEMQKGELRDRAMRAVELSRPKGEGCDPESAKANIERLVDERDTEDGRFSRYLLAVGSPAYKRAFGSYLASGDTGRMTREEQTAWQLGQTAERALSLTGSAGGFAVPFELDPTILNTSNGVVNPIREMSRVIQITVDEWRGVSSAGITASYAAEATETTDNAPTLVQPTISTEKAQAFVPFSIESGQDWPGLQSQMATLLADAKDTLEATKFIAGTGTNEPFGVGVGTTNTVNAAAGADAFTIANLYSLVGSLPPRYRANGAFIGDLLIYNRIRQFFDTGGSNASVWQSGLQAGNPDRLFGKPAYEASAMPDDATTGNKFLIFGDFSRYVIVDRVGLTIEVIPHLFGTAGSTAMAKPTGQRGLYAYWRNGAKVVDANAFRAILGTA